MNESGYYEDISEFLNDKRNQEIPLEHLEAVEGEELPEDDQLVLQVDRLEEDTIAARKGYVGRRDDYGMNLIGENSEVYIPDDFINKVNWYRLSQEK